MSDELKDKILNRIVKIRDEISDLKTQRSSYGEWIDVDINNDIELSILLLEYETKVLFKLIEDNQ